MPWEHFKSAVRRSGILGTYTYESTGEQVLGDRLHKVLTPGVTFATQVPIKTSAGEFRLDMMLCTPGGRRICIEVDGRDYHDEERDFWRTILLYEANEVDAVYRVPGRSLDARYLVFVLADLALHEPRCFSEWTRMEWIAASEQLTRRRFEPRRGDVDADDEYELEDSGEDRSYIFRSRYSLMTVTNRTDVDLQPYIDFVRNREFTSVDGIIHVWNSTR